MKKDFGETLWKHKYLISAIIVVAFVGVIAIIKKDEIKAFFGKSKPVSDSGSESKIQTLHPLIRDKARAVINDCKEQGLDVRVTSGLRTFAEQDKLYAQGRTTSGGIVTNARGGQSNHNFGLAFDVVPFENWIPNWKSKDWNKIGQIGKSHGFVWGGDWTKLVDKPHFEMTFGKTTAQLRDLYNSGKTENGYVKLD